MSDAHESKTIVGSYWQVIVAFRWTLTVVIMVFLRDFPGIQIISLLSISVTIQLLTFASHPLKSSTDQRMSVFNETATSIYLYLMLTLTDYMGDTGLRDEIGWCLTGVVITVVAINLLRVLSRVPRSCSQIVRRIKKWASRGQEYKE